MTLLERVSRRSSIATQKTDRDSQSDRRSWLNGLMCGGLTWLLLGVSTGCFPGELDAAVGESEWEHYFAAAAAVATPHSAPRIDSPKNLAAQYQRQISAVARVGQTLPATTEVYQKLKKSHREADQLFRQLRDIDRQLGKDALGGLGSLLGVLKEGQKPETEQSAAPALQVIGKGLKMAALSKSYDKVEAAIRDHEYRLRSTAASLFPAVEAAVKKSAPAASRLSLGLEYLSAWQGAFANDKLTVTNTGSMPVRNAILLVELIDDEGQRESHLHTVTSLAPGKSFNLTYGYGDSDCFKSQTRDDVRQVDVSVVTRDGFGSARWVHVPEQFDARVKEDCQRLKFSGRYLPAQKAGFFTSAKDPGFAFRFDGLGRLPVSRVEIEFEGEFGRRICHGKQTGYMQPGKFTEWRSDNYPGKPNKVHLRLSFRGTDYVHRATWDFTKQ